MKIWRSAEATAVEPPGHYGHLRVADAVTRQEGRSFSVQVSTCPPGGGGEMHSHENDAQVFFVISGELSFDTGGEQFTLQAGEAVLFEPKEQHATHNHGSEVSTSLVMTIAR
jgi:mannose-6-phosphate isomerase-like protein (cupin superfamily)